MLVLSEQLRHDMEMELLGDVPLTEAASSSAATRGRSGEEVASSDNALGEEDKKKAFHTNSKNTLTQPLSYDRMMALKRQHNTADSAAHVTSNPDASRVPLTENAKPAMKKRSIIVVPSYPSPAPRHHDATFWPFQYVYTAFFNAMQMPCTTVPVWKHEGKNMTKKGGEKESMPLPLSVQLVAAWGHDHLTLAAAEALDNAHKMRRSTICGDKQKQHDDDRECSRHDDCDAAEYICGYQPPLWPRQ